MQSLTCVSSPGEQVACAIRKDSSSLVWCCCSRSWFQVKGLVAVLPGRTMVNPTGYFVRMKKVRERKRERARERMIHHRLCLLDPLGPLTGVSPSPVSLGILYLSLLLPRFFLLLRVARLTISSVLPEDNAQWLFNDSTTQPPSIP